MNNTFSNNIRLNMNPAGVLPATTTAVAILTAAASTPLSVPSKLEDPSSLNQLTAQQIFAPQTPTSSFPGATTPTVAAALHHPSTPHSTTSLRRKGSPLGRALTSANVGSPMGPPSNK
uniref:Uncharacterized protein n=1 Tax=Steinernema glaseri TaxID=37863 RepID=A0A1I8AHQ6_9BILA